MQDDASMRNKLRSKSSTPQGERSEKPQPRRGDRKKRCPRGAQQVRSDKTCGRGAKKPPTPGAVGGDALCALCLHGSPCGPRCHKKDGMGHGA